MLTYSNFILFFLCLLRCTASDKNAIVTLMTSGQEKYTRCLIVFLKSLRSVGYNGDIVLLATMNSDSSQIKIISATDPSVKIVRVQEMSAIKLPKGAAAHYKKMLSKLHIWKLYQYEQVRSFKLLY